MLYDLCQRHHIPHQNCGKWVVAQDSTQFAAIEKVHDFAQSVGVPTRFLSKAEASRREPDVRAEAGVLESPTTGIIDSHGLMTYLQGDFEDKGGITALQSPVTSIKPIDSGKGGWEVTTKTPEGDKTTITAETLINSAGLHAIPLSNTILPKERHKTPYYAKTEAQAAEEPQPAVVVLLSCFVHTTLPVALYQL